MKSEVMSMKTRNDNEVGGKSIKTRNCNVVGGKSMKTRNDK